jgi:hypothetical protein
MADDKPAIMAALLTEARALCAGGSVHGDAARAQPMPMLGIEAVLLQGVAMYDAQARVHERALAATAAAAGASGGAHHAAVEVAWHSEWLSVARIGGDVCSRVGELLAHARRAPGGGAYATVAVLAAEMLSAHLVAALDAHRRRAAWLRAAAGAGAAVMPCAPPDTRRAKHLCIEAAGGTACA